MYVAISYFKDMKDNMHPYNPGDIFPREKLSVDEKRIEELSTDKNRRGKPVIKFVEEKAEDPAIVPEEEAAPKPKKKGKKKNAD